MKRKFIAIVFSWEQKNAFFDVLKYCYETFEYEKHTKQTISYIFHLSNDNTIKNFKTKYNSLPKKLRFKVIELKK